LIFFLTLFLSADAGYALKVNKNNMRNRKAFVNVKFCFKTKFFAPDLLYWKISVLTSCAVKLFIKT